MFLRRAALMLAGCLQVAALTNAPVSQASTIYACVKKHGAAHLFTKPSKCKKGEHKLSWNTVPTAGKNGVNGANGTPGAPGQPQNIVRFKASLAVGSPTPLFTADGISYDFVCVFGGGLGSIGVVGATGAAGISYGLGNFKRPAGQETTTNDLKSTILVETIGGSTEKPIAETPSAGLNGANNIGQDGVWTVSVEGPTSVTMLHMSMETGSTCSVRGTALTIPS
jgi:hypothetical protein